MMAREDVQGLQESVEMMKPRIRIIVSPQKSFTVRVIDPLMPTEVVTSSFLSLRSSLPV
jgi:hypothetical protein